MEETTNAAPQSWAEDSNSWAESIGNNFVRETPSSATGGASAASLLDGDPSSLLPENAAPEGGFEYDMAMPEGIQADSQLLEEFTTIAKENNLPPAIARKILDLEVKNVQRQLDTFTQIQTAWRDELTSDPDFGGARLESTVNQARKALETYDPDGTLLPELNKTGYGNHPGIIRFLARVGRAVREDNAFSARGFETTDKRPLRDRLWPD